MTDQSFDEWTPEEHSRLAEVGRHRSPRAELRARTTDALRARGLIGAGARPSGLSRRVAFGLAAAATIVFAAGVVAGYGVAARRQTDTRRDSVLSGSSGATREVARIDSAPTQGSGGRHVVWF